MKIQSAVLVAIAASSLGIAPMAIAGRPGARPRPPVAEAPCTITNARNPGGTVPARIAPDRASQVQVRIQDGAGIHLRNVSQDGRWLLVEPASGVPAGTTAPQGWVPGNVVGCTG